LAAKAEEGTGEEVKLAAEEPGLAPEEHGLALTDTDPAAILLLFFSSSGPSCGFNLPVSALDFVFSVAA